MSKYLTKKFKTTGERKRKHVPGVCLPAMKHEDSGLTVVVTSPTRTIYRARYYYNGKIRARDLKARTLPKARKERDRFYKALLAGREGPVAEERAAARQEASEHALLRRVLREVKRARTKAGRTLAPAAP